MSARGVFEEFVGSLPRKTRYLTRERLLAFVSLVSQLLSFAVLKRPGLAPVQNAVSSLLTLSGATADRDIAVPGSLVVQQIRKLKERLARARDEEEALQLQAQIDVLMELLVQA
jgi:hypothetical protein